MAAPKDRPTANLKDMRIRRKMVVISDRNARATAGRPYSRVKMLRMRRRSAEWFSRAARATGGVGPYDSISSETWRFHLIRHPACGRRRMPPSPQGEGFWQKIHLSKNKIEAPQSFDFERREWRRGYGDGEQRLNDVRRRNYNNKLEAPRASSLKGRTRSPVDVAVAGAAKSSQQSKYEAAKQPHI